MKKVLLYTRPIVPPWDEASKNLAYEIARMHNAEIEMHVLTDKRSGFEVANCNNRQVVSEPVFTSPSMHLDLGNKLRLLKRLYSFPLGADVVHFLFTPRSLTSTLIQTRLKMGKIKSIQTLATVSEEVYSNPELLRKVFFADMVVAQSYYTQQRLLKAGLTNVSLIYPGIDLKKYSPQEKDLSLMQKLGLKNEDFVILFPGEYTRLKAIYDIVEAFRLLDNTTHLPFKLILACRIKSAADVEKKKMVMEQIQQLGYNDKVVYLDTFAEMPRLYNVADLVIFPVREMTGKFDIPLAVIEPMACKKPVIVSDIPVLQEFIKDGINGSVVEKENPEMLMEKIIQLYQNRPLCQELGENAAKFVAMTFDINSCVKKYEDVYTSFF